MFFFKENRELKDLVKSLQTQIDELDESNCCLRQNVDTLRNQIRELKKPLTKEGLEEISSTTTSEINDVYVRAFNNTDERNQVIKAIIAKRIIKVSDPK